MWKTVNGMLRYGMRESELLRGHGSTAMFTELSSKVAITIFHPTCMDAIMEYNVGKVGPFCRVCKTGQKCGKGMPKERVSYRCFFFFLMSATNVVVTLR